MNAALEKTQQFIQSNKQKFVDELFALLRIPSVSADPKYQGDVAACATHLAAHLQQIGLDAVEVISTAGIPLSMPKKL